MSDARRVLTQAAALIALSVLVGAAVHFPLVGRFARGEFREAFFQASEYPGVRLITLEEAEDIWRTRAAVFIDARRGDLYSEGHVPRSLNLPAEESARTLPSLVMAFAREGTVVVYCEGGGCQSSLALAKRLHEAGCRDVRVFTGGWDEWRAAGLPDEKSDAPE